MNIINDNELKNKYYTSGDMLKFLKPNQPELIRISYTDFIFISNSTHEFNIYFCFI
jgi:hypothetical protein